ncbi:cytoskeleton assembly control protein Sla1 [Trichuris trichiura]|uniref:Cytoskeleton assembly control protein Sla1 n=1 Tax=Trichuris trichiura TaxID=36087 RepID=A0A077ZK09_TRITR|nr:cytoskeleton assembly control protein Sla1 [Trichuris trichiura]
MHYSEHDWILFFEKAGISTGLCRRYAEAFTLHHITPDILPLLSITTLREIGIYPVGDCMLILQHRDRVCHVESFNEQPKTQTLFGPSPATAVNQQKPTLPSSMVFTRPFVSVNKKLDKHPAVRMFQLCVNEVQQQMNKEMSLLAPLRASKGVRFQEGAVSSTSDIPTSGRTLTRGKRPSVFERLGTPGIRGRRAGLAGYGGKPSVFSRLTYTPNKGRRPNVFQRLGPGRKKESRFFTTYAVFPLKKSMVANNVLKAVFEMRTRDLSCCIKKTALVLSFFAVFSWLVIVENFSLLISKCDF